MRDGRKVIPFLFLVGSIACVGSIGETMDLRPWFIDIWLMSLGTVARPRFRPMAKLVNGPGDVMN